MCSGSFSSLKNLNLPRQVVPRAGPTVPTVPLCHPSATPLPPLCHPSATPLPPLCHPSATPLPPLCHPSATPLPPLCHPSAPSATPSLPACSPVFVRSTSRGHPVGWQYERPDGRARQNDACLHRITEQRRRRALSWIHSNDERGSTRWMEMDDDTTLLMDGNVSRYCPVFWGKALKTFARPAGVRPTNLRTRQKKTLVLLVHLLLLLLLAVVRYCSSSHGSNAHQRSQQGPSEDRLDRRGRRRRRGRRCRGRRRRRALDLVHDALGSGEFKRNAIDIGEDGRS
jgi:hypothetical protein